MTIREAIKLLSYRLSTGRPPKEQDFRKALMLSIKALERLQSDRLEYGYDTLKPLPGETESL